jgi:uncharacterized coiled-coil protein SlyX
MVVALILIVLGGGVLVWATWPSKPLPYNRWANVLDNARIVQEVRKSEAADVHRTLYRTVDELAEQVEERDRTIAELQATVRRQVAEVARLSGQVAILIEYNGERVAGIADDFARKLDAQHRPVRLVNPWAEELTTEIVPTEDDERTIPERTISERPSFSEAREHALSAHGGVLEKLA